MRRHALLVVLDLDADVPERVVEVDPGVEFVASQFDRTVVEHAGDLVLDALGRADLLGDPTGELGDAHVPAGERAQR